MVGRFQVSVNGRTNERTNEQRNQRTNCATNDRTAQPTNQRRKERTMQRTNERTNERRQKRQTERKQQTRRRVTVTHSLTSLSHSLTAPHSLPFKSNRIKCDPVNLLVNSRIGITSFSENASDDDSKLQTADCRVLYFASVQLSDQDIK